MTRPNIVVVLPVCRPDFHLAVKWLKWVQQLNARPDARRFDLVVFCAASLAEEHVNVLRTEAQYAGATVEVNPNYYERHDLGYAACANNEFRSALEMTERLFPGRPTLWVEPDTVPMRATWVQEIDEEYARCGKPFMGDFHPLGAIPHMTGNAVYSANWRKEAPSIAALPGPDPTVGWDASCSHETVPKMHRSSRIQQIWIAPRFTAKNVNMVAPSTALFHRDKTGTLIDVLAARLGIPPIPLEPALVAPTQIHATARGSLAAPTKRAGTAIMIVSYRKDLEFLKYCIRAIDKYATGFSEVVLVVPSQEKGLYEWVLPFGVRIHYHMDIEGRGMLCHMIQKCRADQICPNAEFVLHLDADCIVWKPMTPASYMKDGKPIVIQEKYAHVLNPYRRHWQKCVYNALGFYPETEGMTRHPQLHIAEIYSATRNAVEQHVGTSFDSYVIAGQNQFPQSFGEWPTVHAIAKKSFAERYEFIDYDRNKDASECGVSAMGNWQFLYRPERDAIAELWSHGGIEKCRADIESWLAGNVPKYCAK